MSVTPAKRLAILQRRQQAAELYLKGWTQAAIAQHLAVRQKTISTDLKAVRKEWRASMIRDFDLQREEELKKLRLVETEAWGGYERSQKPHQEARVKENDQSKAVKTMKSRIGDPRFLDIVLKCTSARRALLDLDLGKAIVEVHNSGVPSADLAELRRRMLHEPDFIEYCQRRAADADTGPIRADGQPGSLEDGAAPEAPGPGAGASHHDGP
jgi:Putative ATPase subunit of terminase (gpP-like)